MPIRHINSTVCSFTPAGLSHLLNEINLNFAALAKGAAAGSIARFKLQANLAGPTAADILVFDGGSAGGYSLSRSGVVFVEPPDRWTGKTGDEGWCTQRGKNDSEYSILYMSPLDLNGKLNQTYQNLLLNSVGFGRATLTNNLTGGATAAIQDFSWTGAHAFAGTVPTTAVNDFGHYGLAGDEVLLVYLASDGQWLIADVTRHAMSVVLDTRFNAGVFEQQTITAALEVGGTAAWSTVWTGTSCP